jgi:TonB family protein
MGIAHCCLRPDPERRCSAADIAARLRSNSPSSSSVAKAVSKAQGPSTVRIPAASAKWRYILPVAVVAPVAAALLIGPRLLNRPSDSQPAAAVSPGHPPESSGSSPQRSSEISRAQQTRSTKLEAIPVAKPAGRKSGNTNQNSTAAARPIEPAQVEPTPSAAEAAVTSSGQSPVVQQIMPSVSKSAMNTIHGTFKIRVKVRVDSAGDVETASFVSPGPSKYFARQAMQAAQQWKFIPAQGQDARTWVVRFGFRRSGTDAELEPATP